MKFFAFIGGLVIAILAINGFVDFMDRLDGGKK